VAFDLGPDGFVGIPLQCRGDFCSLSLAGKFVGREVLQMVFPYFFDRAAQLFVLVRD
jgi:hypothetical protein